MCSRAMRRSSGFSSFLAVSRAADVRAAVRVQRVVRVELPTHVVVVVLGDGLEACGQRVETRRLRRQLTRVGVRAAHDEGQHAERRILELVFPQEGIEGAMVADVSELHPWNVVGDGPFTLGNRHNLVCRHEEERRVLVDEPRDQPRTGDAVDTRPFTSHPFHRDLLSYFAFQSGSAAAATIGTATTMMRPSRTITRFIGRPLSSREWRGRQTRSPNRLWSTAPRART